MDINLNKFEKDAMAREIKNYFRAERDEEFGDLAVMLLIDFISENLGKYYYNAGVRDARKYISEKLEEIGEIEIY